MKRTFYVESLILAVAMIFLLSSCNPNTKQIKRMQALEEDVHNPTTIEELTAAIKKYQDRVEDIIAADTQVGIWYKILASRYLDNKMYGKALENYRMAIEYYPTNQNLYYYVAVCAGYMAKAALDYDVKGATAEKERYLRLAETSYVRAIELEPHYARALYGLGILYVFELNESAKAIPYLETLLTVETRHTDGMFVLARAYYSTYQFDKAVAMYDKIIETTSSTEKKAEAETNKKLVLDASYE